MNLKFRLHFLTFTGQTIVRLFLDYGQFHQPAVQVLQCEALLVTVTFKCYVFLTGKQVSSYPFLFFWLMALLWFPFSFGISIVQGAVMHIVAGTQDVQEGGTENQGQPALQSKIPSLKKHPSINSTHNSILITTLTWCLKEEAFQDCLPDKMVPSVFFITATTTTVIIILLMHFH